MFADEPSAWELYERGREAEKHGRIAEAYLLYSEAAAADPKNRTYWLRSQALRTPAALLAKPMPTADAADATSKDDAATAATPPLDPATPQDIRDANRALPPTHLAAEPAARDFNLRGDSKELFEQVSKVYGLDCVFDGDYQPVPNLRFELHAADYREALHGLEAATGSFIVPLSARLFLVAKDTPQKRNEVEPTVAVAVRLPDPTVAADFNAMITAVQQAMALEKVSFDTQNNTVIIRDKISKVLPARALLEDLLYPKGQLMVDLRFVEVTRNDMLTYGVKFDPIFSLNFLTNWMRNTFTLPTSIQGLLTFGGGKTLMGLGIINPQIVAQMSQSSGKVLLDTAIRAQSGAPASLHVGDRYPILQAGYYGPQSFYGSGSGSSAAYTPPPQFTYADLGFSLKLTPIVHSMKEVSLDLDAQFQVLTGQSLNGIPIIANRSLKSFVRLEVGEWAAIAGLLNDQDARNLAGVAGLSRVPVLSALTSTHEHNEDKNEVLILMRPVLITAPPSESYTRTYVVGSETRPLTPL